MHQPCCIVGCSTSDLPINNLSKPNPHPINANPETTLHPLTELLAPVVLELKEIKSACELGFKHARLDYFMGYSSEGNTSWNGYVSSYAEPRDGRVDGALIVSTVADRFNGKIEQCLEICNAIPACQSVVLTDYDADASLAEGSPMETDLEWDICWVFRCVPENEGDGNQVECATKAESPERTFAALQATFPWYKRAGITFTKEQCDGKPQTTLSLSPSLLSLTYDTIYVPQYSYSHPSLALHPTNSTHFPTDHTSFLTWLALSVQVYSYQAPSWEPRTAMLVGMLARWWTLPSLGYGLKSNGTRPGTHPTRRQRL